MLSANIIEKMAKLLGKRTRFNYGFHLKRLALVNDYLYQMDIHLNVIKLYKMAEDNNCCEIVILKGGYKLGKPLTQEMSLNILNKIRSSMSIPAHIISKKENANYANSRI